MPKLPLSMLMATLASLVLPWAPAMADTTVGESIWDQQNAIDRAMESVPKGAQVTDTSCESVEVGTGNYHYICRLTYTNPVNTGPVPPGPVSPTPSN